jgi:CheY-like chemotaxis protein
VLLIDDEHALRTAVADMLQELGYSVTEAASAMHAKDAIERGEAFEVVITDHMMPGMTGAEFAALLRTRRPGLPVLLVSGYAHAGEIAPELARLNKPFKQAELAQALEKLLGRQSAKPA